MRAEELAERWSRDSRRADVFRWLNEVGFFRKHLVRDPGCLFRATAEVVYGYQRLQSTVRRQCVQFLSENADKFKTILDRPVEEYAEHMREESAFGGLNEVLVMSHFYRFDFVVIDVHGGPNLNFVHDYGRRIYLLHQPSICHFDLLLPVEYVKISAFCQSIAYKILYEGVFSMTGLDSATDKMLSDGDSDVIANRKMKKNNHFVFHAEKPKSGSDESDSVYGLSKNVFKNPHFNSTSAIEMLNDNIVPFPYKVARGLSPYVYKNVEFDMWFEMKRERDSNLNYNDGLTLQVGVKCFCRMEPEQAVPYICYIQSMTNDGHCTVYIEELGEKKTVLFEQLQALPINQAKPWFTNSKKGKTARKMFPKRKKIYGGQVEVARVMPTRNKIQYKSRLVENKIIDTKDSNNNCLEGKFVPPYSKSIDYDHFDSNIDKMKNYQCLKQFTTFDPFFFTPYSVDFIAAPFTTEQNGTNAANREQSAQNRQSLPNSYSPVPTTANNSNNVVQYPATTISSNADIGGMPAFPNSPMPTSNPSMMISSGNSYVSSYQPIYCLPSVPLPSVRASNHINIGYPVPRPPMMPVNFGVQRSVNNNGSDLPFNDIPTLRYFFNLGIEWMQISGMVWPPLPPPPPPTTPVGAPHAYFYQPSTPNQLALEMQTNLTLDDNSNSSNQDSKNYNNSQNYQKPNGKYNDFKGGRGGHGNRFRRNDYNQDRNNTKNHNNFNNRGSVLYNNKKTNGRCNFNESSQQSNEKKENQENEGNSPSTTPNLPFIPFPPPPLYRYPCYPGEGENMVQNNFSTNFVPYGSPPEEGGSPPLENYAPPPMPPHYMTYLTPPPQVYYPAPSNVQNYFPANYPPQPPSDSPPKQQ